MHTRCVLAAALVAAVSFQAGAAVDAFVASDIVKGRRAVKRPEATVD